MTVRRMAPGARWALAVALAVALGSWASGPASANTPAASVPLTAPAPPETSSPTPAPPETAAPGTVSPASAPPSAPPAAARPDIARMVASVAATGREPQGVNRARFGANTIGCDLWPETNSCFGLNILTFTDEVRGTSRYELVVGGRTLALTSGFELIEGALCTPRQELVAEGDLGALGLSLAELAERTFGDSAGTCTIHASDRETGALWTYEFRYDGTPVPDSPAVRVRYLPSRPAQLLSLQGRGGAPRP